MHQQNQNILTVSQLNRDVRQLLESEFASIWLTGEISNFVRPSSGHWYFSLKDDNAQIRGAMFRGNNRTTRVRPADGMQVLVRARISLYEPRGDYQIIVEQMESAGDGLLKQQFDYLKNQMAAQGLFAQSHKKPIPTQINRVGIITSSTGAAVKDIIAVLKRRAPQLEIIIYPSQVQGQGATEQLVQMLQIAQQRQEVDVIIIGRGGGSLEDLWCFNEQALAMAVFNCQLPIVSAVGHEIDVTICDYVADVRAPTPSAAAELISPDTEGLFNQLNYYRQQISQLMQQRLDYYRHQNQLVEQQLLRSHPQNVLNQHGQKIDEMQLRLINAIKQRLHQYRHQANHVQHRFKLAQNQLNLPQKRLQCQHLAEQLNQLMQAKVEQAKQSLDTQAKQLDIVSPLSTLQRGYSITLTNNEKVVKTTSDVASGDIIETRLSDGKIKSQIL